MIYIRPLIDRWEADKWELYGEKMAPLSDFIWHNEAAGGGGGYLTILAAGLCSRISTILPLLLVRSMPITEELARPTSRTARIIIITASYTSQIAANYTKSLEIFRQVSYHWHKFLGYNKSLLLLLLLLDREVKERYPPRKQAKVISLEPTYSSTANRWRQELSLHSPGYTSKHRYYYYSSSLCRA
ncbi:hypothetical protein DER46DRAFT_630879 [Fusarium sp. MPI-SDFR-AT-0072]|nr:hypothetical protein DER46DRAFT_630879 [Fusarium sp. MPI-SDFR-AT-0072]